MIGRGTLSRRSGKSYADVVYENVEVMGNASGIGVQHVAAGYQ